MIYTASDNFRLNKARKRAYWRGFLTGIASIVALGTLAIALGWIIS